MLWVCYAGAPRPDAFQALQAAAQHAQQAISHPQVPSPALYNQQRPQATSMWAPFLALYQMQAVMGGGLGDGMYPPTALGVAADQFMQQAQHAQQAQQALMLAAQQMASVGTSRAAPQSLGIAIGAGVGQASSLLGHAQTSLPQGVFSFKHPFSAPLGVENKDYGKGRRPHVGSIHYSWLQCLCVQASVSVASETVCACVRALVSAWSNMSSSIFAAAVPQMTSACKEQQNGMFSETGTDQLISALQAFPALAQHPCLLSSQAGWRQAVQQIHLQSQCLHLQSTPPG